MKEENILEQIRGLPLDEQFTVLLHKKIMNKAGAAKRRAKKYYKDLYKKTGVIPGPLMLAAKGVFEGRKCSGRKQSLDEDVKQRFVEMVRASGDFNDDRFIFITRRARTIKNYRQWLEEEFKRSVSISALRRLAATPEIKKYLEKPDYGEDRISRFSFKSEPVFGLLQVDGCTLCYIRIRDGTGKWKKPPAIEIFDTGSRYMFSLGPFFSESSKNAVRLFTQFFLAVELPKVNIRIRPDNAKGFLNLKRPISEMNLRYSLPGGFCLEPDFSRVGKPKDKAHLESSHRSLHNFEMQIIKMFADKIVKRQPEFLFKNGKKEAITVTFLDIGLDELSDSRVFEDYRQRHNRERHYFSEQGRIEAWVPEQKLESFYASGVDTISFTPEMVNDLMKYGYKKVKASVSKKGNIVFGKRIYYVARGAENFSRHRSTPVVISPAENGKLLIFQPHAEGLFLGEALALKPFSKPVKSEIETNEVEKIAAFLELKNMSVDLQALIERHDNGLTLEKAEQIHERNQKRYELYVTKMKQPGSIKARALFNAFMIDCDRGLGKASAVPYAPFREKTK